ncbi:putative LRR receptor-like serine/threonine-protein kinase [Hordeum vulgare]|nr:putative LRR receptor-like serine/threonine-protein kinase [Hordeum vulgare]
MVICLILHGGVDVPNGNDAHVDDLEFDLDIVYDEYQQQSLDRHWEVMAKTFGSEGEAYTFYNQYAKDRGFSIRRDLKRFAKGSSKVLRLRRYLCSRAGKRQAKICTMEGRTRRLRPES